LFDIAQLGRTAGTVTRGGVCARICCWRAPWLTTEWRARYGGAAQPWVTDAEGSTVKEWHGHGHDGRGAEGVLLAEQAGTTAAWCGTKVRSSVE